jgi:hypothetical protein
MDQLQYNYLFVLTVGPNSEVFTRRLEGIFKRFRVSFSTRYTSIQVLYGLSYIATDIINSAN